MAIHKSKSTNLYNQEIHTLLYLIIFTFRLLQAYITSILGLFLFSYLWTLSLMFCLSCILPIFSCMYLFSSFFFSLENFNVYRYQHFCTSTYLAPMSWSKVLDPANTNIPPSLSSPVVRSLGISCRDIHQWNFIQEEAFTFGFRSIF